MTLDEVLTRIDQLERDATECVLEGDEKCAWWLREDALELRRMFHLPKEES